MWFKDKDMMVRRGRRNRKRRVGRTPILMVNARMTEQRQRRVHRLGAIVLFCVALAGVTALLVVGVQFLAARLFTQNVDFTIRKLELSSDGKLQPRHIRQYAKLEEGQNLFAVDIDQVRRDLESVPVVDTVEVRRTLPDTLGVRITERMAIARLGRDDQRYHLAVDREGHVLGPSSRSPELPALIGLRDSGLRPGSYVHDVNAREALAVLDLCDTTRLGQAIKVDSIDVRHPDFLDVRLDRGERILLARDRFEWRLKQLAQIVQTSAGLGKTIASVDLTVDKNFPVVYR